MDITQAFISQMKTNIEWQEFSARQSEEESRNLYKSIDDAIQRATDKFEEKFPDSAITSYILKNSRILQELGKNIAIYLREPTIVPRRLRAEHLGISPQVIPHEQFNLEIIFFWNILRKELMQVSDVMLILELIKREKQELPFLKNPEEIVIEVPIRLNLKSSNILNVEIFLLNSIITDDYFDIVSNILWNIEYIYLVFALIASDKPNDLKALDDLIAKLRPSFEAGVEKKLSRFEFRMTLAPSTVTPLQLVSAHYGSPASFDLLGIGKILEALRDTIKDLIWRGEHEKEMAKLERQSKEAEIEKLRLDSEKAFIDIVSQKIELLEKTRKLKLSAKDKRIIIYAIMPQVKEIANPSPRKYLRPKSLPHARTDRN